MKDRTKERIHMPAEEKKPLLYDEDMQALARSERLRLAKWLGVEIDTLPEAAPEMEDREHESRAREKEFHPCVKCVDVASEAFTMHDLIMDVTRWIDLCAMHGAAFRDHLAGH